MSATPDISVVVAAHNEEELLPRCLDSLFASATEAQLQVIVVDNASTDGTAAVAARPGVDLVSCATLGAVHAKTAGVAAARAEVVAILDADSVCPPDWIDRIARAFAADPKLAGLSGPARYQTRRRWVHAVMWTWTAWWKLLGWLSGGSVFAVGTNLAFRREAFTRAGGFDTEVLVGGDEVQLFRRLRRVGKTRFDRELAVETHARRTEVGFWRFFFSTVIVHYVFNYWIYRLTGRSLVKRYRPGSTLKA